MQRLPSALVDGFRFRGPTISNWLIQGLTISFPTDERVIEHGPTGITVDRCLIEYSSFYTNRIRGASECTIQRCVIREAINKKNNHFEGDSTAIHVGNTDADILDPKILDIEIYNVGDVSNSDR